MRKLFSILMLISNLSSLLRSSNYHDVSRHVQTPTETIPILGPAERDLALHLTQWSQGNESTNELVKTIENLNFDPTTVIEKKGINLGEHLRRKSSPWSVKFAASALTFGALITGSFVAIADQYNDVYQLIPSFVGAAAAVPALIKYGVSRWQIKRILNALKRKNKEATSGLV